MRALLRLTTDGRLLLRLILSDAHVGQDRFGSQIGQFLEFMRSSPDVLGVPCRRKPVDNAFE